MADDDPNSKLTSDSAPLEAPPQPPASTGAPEAVNGTSNDGDAKFAVAGPDGEPLSKNAIKRLKRKAEFEAQREDFKRLKKEKKKAIKVRRREQLQSELDAAEAQGLDREAVLAKFHRPSTGASASGSGGVPVPVALVLDCDFESCMTEREQTSLAGQLMRLAGINRRSPFRFAGMYFGGWKGSLRHRFETVLGNNHTRWKGCRFVEEDFVAAARMAKGDLAVAAKGNGLVKEKAALPSCILPPLTAADPAVVEPVGTSDPESAAVPAQPPVTVPHVEPPPPKQQAEEGVEEGDPSIVYLTSDSPNTITSLRANTVYVIGALVDKNREKGLCYRRAREHGVSTGRLPISEYMELRARHVLTTNQVAEILLRWMQCGDWGRAFLDVIPMRKGGKLRGASGGGEDGEAGEEEDGAALRGDGEEDDEGGESVQLEDEGAIGQDGEPKAVDQTQPTSDP